MDVLIAKSQTIAPDAVNYILLIYSFAAVEGAVLVAWKIILRASLNNVKLLVSGGRERDS